MKRDTSGVKSATGILTAEACDCSNKGITLFRNIFFT